MALLTKNATAQATAMPAAMATTTAIGSIGHEANWGSLQAVDSGVGVHGT